MNHEYELIEAVNQYKHIIVYGAKYRGTVVIERILMHLPEREIFVAVTDARGEDLYCANHAVRNLYEYAQLADSAIVVIAAQPMHQDEMEKNVHSLGFSSIVRINTQLFSDLSIRRTVHTIDWRTQVLESELIRELKRNRFLQYQATNLTRLEHLRAKVRLGGKIKVVFLVTSEAKFHVASVYRAMEKNPLFEVVLFVFDEFRNRPEAATQKNPSQIKVFAESLRATGYNVVFGYDEQDKPIFVDTQEPDILFYCASYMGDSDDAHALKKSVLSNLSCFVNYGMSVSGSRDHYHFENDEILPAWLFFNGNRQEYALAVNNPITGGIYNVLSGHPSFDVFAENHDFVLPDKLQNKKKIVIYAPHWSIADLWDVANFHIFGKCILYFLQEYPDIGFVFKPHPKLELQIRSESHNAKSKCLPTYVEWLEYCQTWENSPNGVIVNDSSYIDWFKHSDCLITDSFSFILFWLPTEKPCIYLTNPKGPQDFFRFYQPYIKPVLESYYLCDSETEIKRLIDEVVIGGADVKAEERRKQADDVIYNLGHAGEYIADYIERKLRD